MNVVQFSRIKVLDGRLNKSSRIVSVTNAEGPPVPIPNTEVKLCSGDNTWREAAREDSSMLTQVRERVKPVPKPEKMVKYAKYLCTLQTKVLWGCSSAGRAPALQAGGHGFESHHLHHPSDLNHLLTT